MARRHPRIYFSFRSPFSWMAIERMRQVVPDVHDVLDFVPYWDPDPLTEQALEERGAGFHYVSMSKAKHLYILHDTKRLTQRFGLQMAWPVDVDPWWEVPHLAWLHARRLGAGSEFYDAVIAARWGRGENICEPEVIDAAAESVGLDGRALIDATDDPGVREEAVECLVDAYNDDVFGIPYFRVGRHRFWGLDRLDDFLVEFLPAIGRAAATAGGRATEDGFPPILHSMTGAYDTDTAGGCG